MEIKTAFTAQRAIFDRLIEANVIANARLTGGIYPIKRPDDSQKEDIVIGSLSMNTEQLQEGVFNVNIHVPNLKMSSGATEPNTARFQEILNVVMPVLTSYIGFDFRFDVKVPGLPYRDGLSWFVNIQVEYWTLRRKN